ncbi:LysR family transcriptional regulator [Ornithinicoccus halotolerans]|uniref:LysR family transcriptional regulator n=1 Tax=Ornithinicoccus halotolerans TaxID=1748220 RepID=UPI0012952FF1|nr:LysR family transcriptional regulator [Ornithinicoccus halotolerans]
MIDLRRLAALQAVAEHRTVTAAAQALHLTPSAVSQQLNQLAHEVGAPLLRHEGRGVRLTPEALVLLEHGALLRQQWERAKADLASLGEQVTGTLRMCGVSSAVAALAAPALARLREVHPRLDTLVLEEESAACYQLLLADEADLAVVLPTPQAPPATDARLEQHHLLEDPLDLLVPAGHRLARSEGVALTEAAGEAWIVKRHNNDSFALLSVACASAGFTPHVTHQVKEWYAVSAMVAAGFGVCLLPRLVPIPREHPVVRVPLRGRPVPARRVVACVRRGSVSHPVVAAGLEALRAAAAGAPDHQR